MSRKSFSVTLAEKAAKDKPIKAFSIRYKGRNNDICYAWEDRIKLIGIT